MKCNFYRFAVVLALLSAFFAKSTPAWSQSVVRVEEDWELVLGEPDADSTSPQVTCAVSPLGHINGLHATFELNHQSQPFFAPGGLQLQVWNGSEPVAAGKFPSEAVMRTTGETVRWTQAVELKDGQLTFEVSNGTSVTWGSFGDQGHLKHTMASPLTDLNSYSPLVSVEHSGVGYAQNRVESLALKQVRLVLSTGQVLVDPTYHVVHEH